MNFKKYILDLIFPVKCLGCGQSDDFLCPNCLKKIQLNRQIIYPKNSPLFGLIIAGSYKEPLLKEAIHKYKYDLVKDLTRPLADLMMKKLNDCPWFKENNVLLIPVPLHKKRLRWRGFNQTELLAERINQQLNIPLADNILERIKHAPPQVKIKDPQIRKRNIKEAFRIRPAPSKISLSNKTIILIDDVLTTGATLEECARALKKAGAQKIWGLVLARG